MKRLYFRPLIIILAILFLFSGTLVYSYPRLTAVAYQPTQRYSKAECVIELNSRRVLYEENGDVRLPMASTTKIVTCITVLEICNDIKSTFPIPQEAVGVEGSSVYLQAQEIYSVEDLLYGLMLRSGNDCATALALFCSGSIANFAAEMNKIAQKAGALHSNFENPHGLPHKNHYTTARDLSYITAYAMQNPTFRKIVGAQNYPSRGWKNKNKLLFSYESCIGVKTGYTKEAGRCLVAAAKQENMCVISCVLNCPSMYERSKKLLQDSLSSYQYEKIIDASVPLNIEGSTIRGIADKDYYYPLLKEEKGLIEIRTYAHENMRIENREIVGKFEIYLAKRLLFSGNLYKL
ncbi:MAG: D-alanyl-D-alanine carboxypeptidase [Clostridiales bacterium]|nr:D-alanyl-D-alanine carboxypeptidase [Clostridiales bacterium]